MAPPPAASTATVLAVAAAALLFGSGNTFTTKVLITAMPCDPSCAPPGSVPGATVPFNKPIFSTLIAFGGMAAGLLYYLAQWVRRRRGSRASQEAGADASLLLAGGQQSEEMVATEQQGEGEEETLHKRAPSPPAGVVTAAGALSAAFVRYQPLALPASMDVTATALQAAASLFIPAAVNAVLRGSILLFTAVANRLFGVRDASAGRAEWAAITVSMLGVCQVGLSAVLNNSGGTRGGSPGSSGAGLPPAAMAAVGVSLALLSNMVQAGQVAYETRFLEGAVYEPVEANAAEGVIGVGICAGLLALSQAVPYGPDNGHVEDSAGTACCLASTPSISGVSFLLWLLFGLSTVAHMRLSLLRGSNFRSFILCGRSLLVWAMEFAAFYATGGRVGSGWQPYSWLEAAGFAVLAAGGVAQFVAQNQREGRGKGGG